MALGRENVMWLGCVVILALAGLPAVAPAADDRPQYEAAPQFDVDLGKPFGLSFHATEAVGSETVRDVVHGAEQKNRESLYFLGLLRLYGQGGLNRDPTKASKYIRESAELGHLDAQTAIAMLLLAGHGVTQDATAALAWLRRSASQGHVNGQWLLGRTLYEAEAHLEAGTTKDRSHRGRDGTAETAWAEAREAFLAAAEQESPEAQHYLGLMHEYGRGVKLDFYAAAQWYRKAAEQAYPASVYNLGLMQAYGRGLTQDFSRALMLFHEASRLNHAPAMYYVGLMAMYGHGIPVDYNAALLWFGKAAALDDPKISDQARQAEAELKESLAMAKKRNEELQGKYEHGVIEDPTVL